MDTTSDFDLCGAYKYYPVINVHQPRRLAEITRRGLDCDAPEFAEAEVDWDKRMEQRRADRRASLRAGFESRNSVPARASQPAMTPQMQSDFNEIFGSSQSNTAQLASTGGFKVATNSFCYGDTKVYQYEFVDNWSPSVDAVIYLSSNLIAPDITMAATADSVNADLSVGPNMENADMTVCKSSGLSVKKIFVTQDAQYLALADVKVKLVNQLPMIRNNFYVIYVDETQASDFDALESVGLIPAIWHLNER